MYLTTMDGINISVSPQSALVDEKVAIAVKGLSANQPVTIVTLLDDDRNFRFASYAWYTSDDKGWLDLSTMPACGGRYEGVEPMGLFCTLQPSPSQPKGTRLMKKDVTRPYIFSFHAVDGHHSFTGDETVSGTVSLAQCYCERWYLAESVQRLPVQEGRLRGTLFIPRGPGPHPGVIDLFGTVGGLVEYRAALLASRGIAAFALQYFTPGTDDPMETDLEYFVSAVDFLLSHPRVSPHRAGAVGVSRGMELVLYLACVCPRVRAVVAISGLWFNSLMDLTFNNEVIPFPYAEAGHPEFGMQGAFRHTDEGLVLALPANDAIIDFYRPYMAPVERSRARFLILHGREEKASSYAGGKALKQHMETFGRGDEVEAIVYPGTGHLIEPPYSPHCYSSYHGMFSGIMVWGGNARDHSRAQEDAWARILRFFREHLNMEPQLSRL